MRFKLDENFGRRTLGVFCELGHDVETVHDEGLQGCPDGDFFALCSRERRCLVTLIGGLFRALPAHPVAGNLWIVEPGRIRIHQAEDR